MLKLLPDLTMLLESIHACTLFPQKWELLEGLDPGSNSFVSQHHSAQGQAQSSQSHLLTELKSE